MNLPLSQRLKRKSATFFRFGQIPLALDKPCLSFTIDDFPLNAWTNGRDILADHDTRATFYVSGGLCDGEVLGLPQYNLETLHQVHEAGHEIGSHTFDHFNACQVPLNQFIESVDRNAAFFDRHLPDVKIESFAYPYGDMTPWTKHALSKRFTSCRGTHHGVHTGQAEASDLHAICLQINELSKYDLEKTLAEAAVTKSWVVVLTHDISSDPTPYGCRPEQLVELLTLANRNGYEILPVGAVVARSAAS